MTKLETPILGLSSQLLLMKTKPAFTIPNKLWGYWYTNAWPRGPLPKVFKEPAPDSGYWYAWEYTICVL